MNIKGREGMTGDQLGQELQRGGKFVDLPRHDLGARDDVRRGSDVNLLRSGESAAA